MKGYFVGYLNHEAIGGPTVGMCCGPGDSRVFAKIEDARKSLAYFRRGDHLKGIPGGFKVGIPEYRIYWIEEVSDARS